MNPALAYATAAHFALAAAANEPGARATVLASLIEVATKMGLPEEESKAARALRAIEDAEEAQMTFDSLILRRLGKEAA